MARFRLLAPTFLDGRRYPAGAEIDRPDNWRGPTRSVPKRDQETGHQIFSEGRAQTVDEPLYESIDKEDEHHG